MKKQLITALSCCILSSGLLAQEEMKVEWTQKFDHQTDWVGTGLEGPDKVSFVATDKKVTVYKTSDGSIMWSGAYKELLPKFRKVDAFAPFWESGAIFLFDKKLGKDKLAVLDLKTGNVLWESEVYQGLTVDNIEYIPEKDGFILSLENSLTFVDARTGEEKWESTAFKGSIAMWQYIDGDAVMLNVTPLGLRGFFKGFKNQIARMNLDNGDILWSTTYVGIPERKIVTKERVYDMNIEGGKVFLTLNGLQVFDVNSGATLWAASFDNTFGSNAAFGKSSSAIYGAIADPLIVGREVYIVGRTKKKKFVINKYDMNTGKVLWSSPEFKAAKAVPNIFVINDKLIAQVGGVVEVQSITVTVTDGVKTTTYSVGTQNIKPNGLMAFNTSDGSPSWDSEKFKKGITNAFADGDNLIVSSGKSLYSIRYSDGNVNYEEDVKNGGVGNAVEILKYKDNIVVVGEKGVSLFTIAEGKMVKASKYKKASSEKLVDNILLMRTAKNDFAAFNLDDCSYVMYNAKNTSQQELSEDGDFVWAYEKKVVTKLKTR